MAAAAWRGQLRTVGRPLNVVRISESARHLYHEVDGPTREYLVDLLRTGNPTIVVNRPAAQVAGWLGSNERLPTRLTRYIPIGEDEVRVFAPDIHKVVDIIGDGDDAGHTVFGTLQMFGSNIGEPSYGNVAMTLKPEVALRATFSYGDTLDYGRPVGALEQLDRVLYKALPEDGLPNAYNYDSLPSAYREAASKIDVADARRAAVEYLASPKKFSSYLEVQISGGIRPSDVASIREVPVEAFRTNMGDPQLVANAADAVGIPYTPISEARQGERLLGAVADS